MAINKPMEITFDDIKYIIIDIVLVECNCVLFIFGSVNVSNTDKTPGDFRIWCARKKDCVSANIAAANLPLSVCSYPNCSDANRVSVNSQIAPHGPLG